METKLESLKRLHELYLEELHIHDGCHPLGYQGSESSERSLEQQMEDTIQYKLRRMIVNNRLQIALIEQLINLEEENDTLSAYIKEKNVAGICGLDTDVYYCRNCMTKAEWKEVDVEGFYLPVTDPVQKDLLMTCARCGKDF